MKKKVEIQDEIAISASSYLFAHRLLIEALNHSIAARNYLDRGNSYMLDHEIQYAIDKFNCAINRLFYHE